MLDGTRITGQHLGVPKLPQDGAANGIWGWLPERSLEQPPGGLGGAVRERLAGRIAQDLHHVRVADRLAAQQVRAPTGAPLSFGREQQPCAAMTVSPRGGRNAFVDRAPQ